MMATVNMGNETGNKPTGDIGNETGEIAASRVGEYFLLSSGARLSLLFTRASDC